MIGEPPEHPAEAIECEIDRRSREYALAFGRKLRGKMMLIMAEEAISLDQRDVLLQRSRDLGLVTLLEEMEKCDWRFGRRR